jgi:GNAT superfamily N-acetyltransferase
VPATLLCGAILIPNLQFELLWWKLSFLELKVATFGMSFRPNLEKNSQSITCNRVDLVSEFGQLEPVHKVYKYIVPIRSPSVSANSHTLGPATRLRAARKMWISLRTKNELSLKADPDVMIKMPSNQEGKSKMRISISDSRSNTKELAKFFRANLTSSYISHSELQGYRAVRPGLWADDVEHVLREEIECRLAAPRGHFPLSEDWKGVIEARDVNESLVSVALVTLSRKAVVPFAIIEDIVVDDKRRGHGAGREMVHWIIAAAREAGIRRVFLESGTDNADAHHFFEQVGFQQISIVMMRDI